MKDGGEHKHGGDGKDGEDDGNGNGRGDDEDGKGCRTSPLLRITPASRFVS